MKMSIAAFGLGSALIAASASAQTASAPVTLTRKTDSISLVPSATLRAFKVLDANATLRIGRAIERGGLLTGTSKLAAGIFRSTQASAMLYASTETAAELTRPVASATSELPVYSLNGLDVVVTQDIIVQFLPSVSDEAQRLLAASIGATSRPITGAPGRIFTLSSPAAALAAVDGLNANPDVRYAEPNFVGIFPPRPSVAPRPMNVAGPVTVPPPPLTTSVTATAAFPSDALFAQQWGLHNTAQKERDIRIEAAWRATRSSAGVTIAILDDGVDPDHPDLKDKIVHPFDAIAETNSQKPNSWDAHGTASAGIAAAATNNGLGIAGVGLEAKIMPVRIASTDETPNADGTRTWVTSMEIIGRAIYHAVDSGADVLSNSWNGGLGATNSAFVSDALRYALTQGRGGKGTVVVFSAGNGGFGVEWPATLAASLDIIAVAATNEWDQLKTATSDDHETWWASDVGTEVTVAAPGVHLVTTDISGAGGFTVGDYVFNFNGTSGAAPHVAGVAALLIAAHPEWTAQQVRDKIASTADKSVLLPDQSFASFGRLNACKALDAPVCD